MGLSCDSGGFDSTGCDWWWETNLQYYPLKTKRSRKGCSCGQKISVGDDSIIVHRHHAPNNDIKERIYGDEVPMRHWYLCDTCGGLAISLDELGFCYSLGDEPLAEQIKDYRKQEEEHKQYLKSVAIAKCES